MTAGPAPIPVDPFAPQPPVTGAGGPASPALQQQLQQLTQHVRALNTITQQLLQTFTQLNTATRQTQQAQRGGAGGGVAGAAAAGSGGIGMPIGMGVPLPHLGPLGRFFSTPGWYTQQQQAATNGQSPLFSFFHSGMPRTGMNIGQSLGGALGQRFGGYAGYHLGSGLGGQLGMRAGSALGSMASGSYGGMLGAGALGLGAGAALSLGAMSLSAAPVAEANELRMLQLYRQRDWNRGTFGNFRDTLYNQGYNNTFGLQGVMAFTDVASQYRQAGETVNLASVGGALTQTRRMGLDVDQMAGALNSLGQAGAVGDTRSGYRTDQQQFAQLFADAMDKGRLTNRVDQMLTQFTGFASQVAQRTNTAQDPAQMAELFARFGQMAVTQKNPTLATNAPQLLSTFDTAMRSQPLTNTLAFSSYQQLYGAANGKGPQDFLQWQQSASTMQQLQVYGKSLDQLGPMDDNTRAMLGARIFGMNPRDSLLMYQNYQTKLSGGDGGFTEPDTKKAQELDEARKKLSTATTRLGSASLPALITFIGSVAESVELVNKVGELVQNNPVRQKSKQVEAAADANPVGHVAGNVLNFDPIRWIGHGITTGEWGAENGLPGHAMGGVITQRINTSAGPMGEAGPEAILPLTDLKYGSMGGLGGFGASEVRELRVKQLIFEQGAMDRYGGATGVMGPIFKNPKFVPGALFSAQTEKPTEFDTPGGGTSSGSDSGTVQRASTAVAQAQASFAALPVQVGPPAKADQFNAAINAAAQQYKIDPRFVKAVIQNESGFNPTAKSKAGALGLMQLMPGTAYEMGVDNPYDPAQNIQGGTRYLRKMLDQFGDDPLQALAAYNWGAGNVAAHGLAGAPKDTKDYLNNVLSTYRGYGGQTGGASTPNSAVDQARQIATQMNATATNWAQKCEAVAEQLVKSSQHYDNPQDAKRDPTFVATSDPNAVPAGAIAIFSPGKTWASRVGHAAVAEGNGMTLGSVDSTGKIGEVPMETIIKQWGEALAGYRQAPSGAQAGPMRVTGEVTVNITQDGQTVGTATVPLHHDSSVDQG